MGKNEIMKKGFTAWIEKGFAATNPYKNSYSDEWLYWEEGWSDGCDNYWARDDYSFENH